MAAAQQHDDYVPKLRVATIKPSDPTVAVTLPATTAAFAQANVFARASGYIDKRNVDIGDNVKAGDLLAHITAPEIEHQIQQAQASIGQSQAALQQAQANAELADVTWGRDKPLVQEGWVTKQQGSVDEQTLEAQQAAVGVAQQNLAAQQAQLKVFSSNRTTRVWLPRSMAPSPSAISTSAAWCRPIRQSARSCSPSCKAT
jgi:multidrug efflux pump subunit AcrA (membrane-fusion protein)